MLLGVCEEGIYIFIQAGYIVGVSSMRTRPYLVSSNILRLAVKSTVKEIFDACNENRQEPIFKSSQVIRSRIKAEVNFLAKERNITRAGGSVV